MEMVEIVQIDNDSHRGMVPLELWKRIEDYERVIEGADSMVVQKAFLMVLQSPDLGEPLPQIPAPSAGVLAEARRKLWLANTLGSVMEFAMRASDDTLERSVALCNKPTWKRAG